MNIKKIMVPLAFSQFSQRLLDYSAMLADAFGAELILVNVINERDLAAVDKISSFGFKVDSEHYVETVKKERREAIADMASRLSLPDDRVSFIFLIGDPSTELLRFRCGVQCRPGGHGDQKPGAATHLRRFGGGADVSAVPGAGRLLSRWRHGRADDAMGSQAYHSFLMERK